MNRTSEPQTDTLASTHACSHHEMMTGDPQQSVAAIGGIEAVPTILDVVCRITGMGFAAVARVTENRWIACRVHDEIAFGLRPGGELKVETTICHEIRQNREPVVINNVAESDVYCRHPTPKMYGFQSYISMPIVLPDGTFFGTLCAIDPRPARLNTPEILGMFRLFAELIAFHLDALERMASSEASLLNERQTSDLREQFIAVLGHDLRNPLSAIGASAELLQKTPLTEKASRMVALIRQSVSRMSALIDDVLDFARGRMGTGLVLNSNADAPLTPVLEQIIAELRVAWPDRVIEEEFSIIEPVMCDRGRIGQLLSNLLGNALKYGAPGAPVRVRAITDPACFTLAVSNQGDPIPPAALEHLFQPFSRGAIQPNQQGLGLGLYIASEVARAHNGTLKVASSADETRFTFRMPLA
ncbi:MAG TPA: GAF domain-containing sensor histidine kinase [Acetobacteraceae bacterium]